MQQLLLFLHVILCISLIVLVLVQHGRGADMGVAFGGGSSSSFFGSQGSSSFLVKLTTSIAALFFISSLVFTVLTKQARLPDSVDSIVAEEVQPSDKAVSEQKQSAPMPKQVDKSSKKK